MNKKSLIKLFILLAITPSGVIETYGYAEAEQSIPMTVQPSVAIEKMPSLEKGTINPMNGVHTGLKSVFSLKTNGNDDDYDFILSSRIKTTSGEVSAYGNNGQILFAHTLAMPTESDIADAKAGGNNNKNVIAYPVNATVNSPMTIGFYNNYGTYGDCYVVKVNNSKDDGTITHSVGTTPVSGSYSIAQDQAGTYQSVVYFTAVSK